MRNTRLKMPLEKGFCRAHVAPFGKSLSIDGFVLWNNMKLGKIKRNRFHDDNRNPAHRYFDVCTSPFRNALKLKYSKKYAMAALYQSQRSMTTGCSCMATRNSSVEAVAAPTLPTTMPAA